jgi:hypothetical protein
VKLGVTAARPGVAEERTREAFHNSDSGDTLNGMAEAVAAAPPAAAPAAFVDREEREQYNAPRVDLSLNDFNILGHVGDGSFSSVILCSHKQTNTRYAIKVISKHLVIRNKMVEYIKNERHILDQLHHVGVAKLFFTFQVATHVLPLADNAQRTSPCA